MFTTIKEIVIIDDDKDTNELNLRCLNDSHFFQYIHIFIRPFEVIQFTKELLQEDKKLPGLYLIDLMMPEMDGFELMDELNNLFDSYKVVTRPKFVIVSGSTFAGDFEKYKRSHNSLSFVRKPMQFNDVNQIINKISA